MGERMIKLLGFLCREYKQALFVLKCNDYNQYCSSAMCLIPGEGGRGLPYGRDGDARRKF